MPRPIPPEVATCSLRLYTTRAFGGLFPSTDHLFLHTIGACDASTIFAVHGQARAWVNSLHRVPRVLRWHVPNIVTMLFFGAAPEPATLEAIRGFDNDLPLGGERHSIFLVEPDGSVVGGRIKTTRVRPGPGVAGLAITFPKLNPDNRAYHLSRELAAAIHSTER